VHCRLLGLLSFSAKTLDRIVVRLTKMWGRVWGRLFADPKNKIDIKSLF
jgi:hypothetical protein